MKPDEVIYYESGISAEFDFAKALFSRRIKEKKKLHASGFTLKHMQGCKDSGSTFYKRHLVFSNFNKVSKSILLKCSPSFQCPERLLQNIKHFCKAFPCIAKCVQYSASYPLSSTHCRGYIFLLCH